MTEPEGMEVKRPRWRRRIAAVLLLVVIAGYWWAPPVLRHLAFFNVRHVEVRGMRFADPAEITARLHLDTLFSIWNELAPLEDRVRHHPQVAEVEISRRLPATLVVTIVENEPVAFAPSPTGLHAYDAIGRLLPLDPSKTPVDLPIIPKGDTALLRVLADVKDEEPDLFARISELRRVGRDEFVFDIASVNDETVPVRTMSDISVDRLAQISLVEKDLAMRHARVLELDLRFKDQVIARLQ